MLTSVRPLEIDILATLEIDTLQLAVFVEQVNQPVGNQRDAHVGCHRQHPTHHGSLPCAVTCEFLIHVQADGRPGLRGRHHDRAGGKARRCDKAKRAIVLLGVEVGGPIEAAKTPHLVPIIQRVAGDAVGSMHDEKLPLSIPIEKRGGVGMLALKLGIRDPVKLPDSLAGSLFQANHLANPCLVIEPHRTVQELQVEVITVEDWRAGHAKLNIQFAEAVSHVELPDLLAVAGVAGQHTGAEEDPDMLAIRGRGGGS